MRTWSALLPVMALFTQLACATEPEPTDESSANSTETAEQELGVRSCAVVRCRDGYRCVESPTRPATCVPVEGLGEASIWPPPSPPPSDPPSTVCQLPLDPGWCKAYFPSWGFNVRTGRCEQFIYGGCGGNANRFKTQAECERICPAGTPPPRPPIGPF